MIESAILHGGTSTICVVGTPPEDVAWHVGIARPEKDLASPFADLVQLPHNLPMSRLAHQRSRFTNASPPYLCGLGKIPFNQEIEHSATLSIHETATRFPVSGSMLSCMRENARVTHSPLPCW